MQSAEPHVGILGPGRALHHCPPAIRPLGQIREAFYSALAYSVFPSCLGPFCVWDQHSFSKIISDYVISPCLKSSMTLHCCKGEVPTPHTCHNNLRTYRSLLGPCLPAISSPGNQLSPQSSACWHLGPAFSSPKVCSSGSAGFSPTYYTKPSILSLNNISWEKSPVTPLKGSPPFTLLAIGGCVWGCWKHYL